MTSSITASTYLKHCEHKPKPKPKPTQFLDNNIT